MRAILVAAILFGAMPFVFKRPWLGVLLWVFVSVMNPHRLTFGFAYNFPFAAVIAGLTIFSGLVSREPNRVPVTSVTAVLFAFMAWMSITTPFALNPSDEVFAMWNKVFKIFLMTFVSAWLLSTRRHVHLLIWVLVASVGYYGVKGGIWTILHGGTERVWGPAGSFIEDNNALALALVMMIPLMRYLQLNASNWWLRWGLVAAMLLCTVAALGSYSRGALLAMGAMVVMMWLKSRRKIVLWLVTVALIPIAISFMPEKWEARMNTIGTYEEDRSASSRFIAWQTMFNIAKDRPIVGGGFAVDTKELYARYSPDPSMGEFVAHSIYLQALGEHGFVGLILYLLVLLTSWKTASWIARNTSGDEELGWARDVAAMIQVSLACFVVGGAFLSLVYFDVPYYLMVALVVTRQLVEQRIKAKALSAADLKTPEEEHRLDLARAKGAEG